MRKRGGRKRAISTKVPMTILQDPNSTGTCTSSRHTRGWAALLHSVCDRQLLLGVPGYRGRHFALWRARRQAT